MKRLFSRASGVLAATMVTVAVSAQTPGQPASAPAMTQSGQQLKLIGCIQREADVKGVTSVSVDGEPRQPPKGTWYVYGCSQIRDSLDPRL